jgi:hypothetical protein
MLANRTFVPLTSSQVKTFLGKQVIVTDPRHRLRPFLVRAIGAQGVAAVRWDGHVLGVTGSAMGACPEVAQQPIIVFLERPPVEVFVNTDGAL